MSKILKKREKMERVVGKGSAVLATTIVGPLPLEGLALVKCPLSVALATATNIFFDK